jgi:NADH:ubiquinone oxidoreductase subunit F (NADH-binding)/NADH:ubiquinone oxidoreductase subunit E
MRTETRERIKSIIEKYPKKESAVLPILMLLQRENGNHLGLTEMEEAAAALDMTMSSVYGVATYYTLFNTQPVGRYHLQVDTCVPGFLHGADEIVEHLSQTLGISVGETTEDGLFTLSTVQDLASAATGPVIQVNDRYFENMTRTKTDQLIAALREGQYPDNDPSMNVVSEGGILLNDRIQKDCRTLAFYKRHGGYQALSKAKTMEPVAVVNEVTESQLRGRGGACFPAGTKWSFLRKDDSGPVYLICNADEGEPGTFKDRQIMEYNPHLLIEGIAISAYAIGATKAFIFIRGELSWIADNLETAIEEAEQDGKLSHVDIVVHRGAGSYVSGDETGLIESLEGGRAHPRAKPPFPASQGLYGRPTIVNNVETLANVPYIVLHGAAAFKKLGGPTSFGTRLFGVSGHVNKPGIFEYPLGTKLQVILEAAGGVKGNLKGIIVGGLSTPILTAAEAEDLSLDFYSCKQAGTALASGGIIVISDSVSIPKLALRTIEFYAHESCGQCVPCREGTRVIVSKLRAIVDGRGKQEDIDLILSLCGNTQGATLCPTGDAYSIPIQAMITKFRAEFEALVQ